MRPLAKDMGLSQNKLLRSFFQNVSEVPARKYCNSGAIAVFSRRCCSNAFG